MKAIIKKTILGILLVFGLLMLMADGDTAKSILTSKLLFLGDAIFMGCLWQWWHMDDYYRNLEED